jgi:nitroreductase
MLSNETLTNIRCRRSIRSYREDQINDEELETVLEAAQYAPNAGGQVWHFTVVQDRKLLDRLNLAAKEAAQSMAFEHLRDLGRNPEFHCLYHAPTLVIVSGNGNSPVPLDADCAAATENLLIAAESIGLGSCWIFFVLLAFSSPEGAGLREELKIPAGYKPFCSAVLGYRKTAAASPPPRKQGLVTYIR